MARIKTWEISDEFWALVEPLIPQSPRTPGKKYKRKPGGGRKPKYSNRVYFAAIVYVLRTGIIWNALPREKFEGVGSAAVHRKFQQWAASGFLKSFGAGDWRNTTNWKGLPGCGKQLMGRISKLLLQKSRLGLTQLIAEKKEASGVSWSTKMASPCRSSSPVQIGMIAY